MRPDHSDAFRLARVWDVPTRLFHWLLVAFVASALATGFVAPEWWMGEHMAAGYAILLLLAFRLVWGAFGSEYSRLVSFAYRPQQVIEYLRGLLLLRPAHYIGHNPAGAVMIFALFGVLTGLVVTGLMMQGGEEKQGPFAGITGYALGNGAKGIHRVLVYALFAMVAAHVAGVLVDGRLHRSALVRAMITGWKRLPTRVPMPAARPARVLAAAASFSVMATAAAIALAQLSRLPPLGIPTMVPDRAWLSECGSCHNAFHPSLLPRASWAALMAGLNDHFGEDASLPPATAAAITAFLDKYAGEAWDSEAARRFAKVAAAAPLRITATPYWVAKHAGIDSAVFASPAVKTKSNCLACHRDAANGRFDDQAIAIADETATGANP